MGALPSTPEQGPNLKWVCKGDEPQVWPKCHAQVSLGQRHTEDEQTDKDRKEEVGYA